MDVQICVTLITLLALVVCDQCEGWYRHRAPSNGLRMPCRRRLMTWDTYVNKVAGRTWSEVYLLPIKDDFPDVLRYQPSPVRSGDSVFHGFHIRDETGVCRTEDDYDWYTNFTHPAGEKYTILKAGSGEQEDRYFSSDPDVYMFFVQCFNVSTIVDGVCMGDGLLSFEVREFPPNQLNWWRIVRDLNRVMGLTFTDRRWRFVAGADGCPDG